MTYNATTKRMIIRIGGDQPVNIILGADPLSGHLKSVGSLGSPNVTFIAMHTVRLLPVALSTQELMAFEGNCCRLCTQYFVVHRHLSRITIKGEKCCYECLWVATVVQKPRFPSPGSHKCHPTVHSASGVTATRLWVSQKVSVVLAVRYSRSCAQDPTTGPWWYENILCSKLF